MPARHGPCSAARRPWSTAPSVGMSTSPAPTASSRRSPRSTTQLNPVSSGWRAWWCPGSPTRTRTSSTAGCGGGPTTDPARSGPGGTGCTGWPVGWTRTACGSWPLPVTWSCSVPVTPRWGSSTTCITRRAAAGTPNRTPWGWRWPTPPSEAGIDLTLLDIAYLAGGFGVPVNEVQQRFSDGTAGSWADRVAELPDSIRVGVGIHSVRAVPFAEMPTVVQAAGDDRVLHVHLSEQPAENADCLAATGLTPTGLLAAAGALGPRTAVVHGTHLTDDDIALLGGAGCSVVICPTTEADLADGLPAAARLAGAGASLSLGGDQQVVVDPVRSDPGAGVRRAAGRRAARRVRTRCPVDRCSGVIPCRDRVARRGPEGGRAGRPGGGPDRQRSHGGCRARTAGHVRVRRGCRGGGGRRIDPGAIREPCSVRRSGTPGGRGDRECLEVSVSLSAHTRTDATSGQSTLLHGISELVTNDPAAGPGLLGLVPDAAVVIKDGLIEWVGAAATAPAADRRRRPRRSGGPARLGRLALACGVRRRPGGGVLGPDGGDAVPRRRDAGDGGRHPRGRPNRSCWRSPAGTAGK